MSRSTTAKVGERVALVRCNDPHTKLESGATGTVRFVDDMGTVHVKWDSGASLGLCADDGDEWIVIAPAEMSQAPTMPKARPDYDPKVDWPERYQEGPIA